MNARLFRQRRRSAGWSRRARRRPEIDARAIGWSVVAAAVLGLAGWGAIHADQAQRTTARDVATLCLLHHRPPTAALALVDQTDPLAAAAGERFRRIMRDVRSRLVRGDRLIAVPFSGDLGRSLAPKLDLCSPGTADEANELVESRSGARQTYEASFSEPVEKLAYELQNTRASRFSPIAQQIEHAVNDPSLGWHGARRELLIMTDGLQHDEANRIYTGAPMALPTPPSGLLAGVTVRYYELASTRRPDLQTLAVRAAWRDWFIAAGAAEVIMYAPGFVSSDR